MHPNTGSFKPFRAMKSTLAWDRPWHHHLLRRTVDTVAIHRMRHHWIQLLARLWMKFSRLQRLAPGNALKTRPFFQCIITRRTQQQQQQQQQLDRGKRKPMLGKESSNWILSCNRLLWGLKFPLPPPPRVLPTMESHVMIRSRTLLLPLRFQSKLASWAPPRSRIPKLAQSVSIPSSWCSRVVTRDENHCSHFCKYFMQGTTLMMRERAHCSRNY